MRPGGLLRWARSPGSIAFVAFLISYLALVRYCHWVYYRDPTSAFFDPVRGYEKRYSNTRQQEANSFIDSANSSTTAVTGSKHARTCIGVATIARNGEEYVRSTLGSLLDRLTSEERNDITLMVLIAHTAPHVHPIYSETWLANIVDKVLLYDVNQKQMIDLQQWEKDRDYQKKAIFDYAYLLQRCHDTGAEYTAMIEDDTLAVKGWYPRALEALEVVDEQYPDPEQKDWLYMRMFFTEEFLGWNSEEWPRYVAGSVGVVGVVTVILLLARQIMSEAYVSNALIAVVCLICTPACILLYFLAGRLSMQPLQPGVFQMPKFGCCAQGLVFSNRMAPKVIARLAQKREGFVDVLIEAWANEANLDRWVVMPSLLQHIGGHSSKGDDFGSKSKYDRSVAEKIWNFGFELYDDSVR